MAGSQQASRILHLVALVCGGNCLLTRRLQGPCSNSDGVSGYNFSHKGLWVPGYRLVGTSFTKRSCSEECTHLTGCVAFSGSFKEDGGNGACYTYTATAGSVPAASDRAYKKCLGRAPETATIATNLTAMHLVATKALTIEALAKLAEGMETQLDAIAKTMADADLRMRRLKSMVAGTSAMLTDASRISSETSKTALSNRGGLLAIARARGTINETFTGIDSSSTRIQTLLKKITDRSASSGKSSSLSALEPNVTSLEKQLKALNDPATLKQIDDVVKAYKTFQDGVTAKVKTVLRTHLRGLVDTQREAFYNYTTAIQNHKKDPCCCK